MAGSALDLVCRGGLGGNGFEAGCVEDDGSDLGFLALRGNLLAVEEEANTRSIADLDGNLARGANGCVSWRDERLLRNQLAISED